LLQVLMKLIVGLGNPERQYADTRHNVGWRVAEVLAARGGAGPWREKMDAAVTSAAWGDEKVWLARPLTFMNNSGLAVRQMMDFWKLAEDALLVVVDDLALDVGRIRLRPQGSAGGHNGLESILTHLGHDRFARLRIGIGPGPGVEEQANFVLSPFRSADRPLVTEAVDRAADAAECWITHGLAEAMNRFNRVSED
jgi:PTH1 family peptidyl-tRNA hydrolase